MSPWLLFALRSAGLACLVTLDGCLISARHPSLSFGTALSCKCPPPAGVTAVPSVLWLQIAYSPEQYPSAPYLTNLH